LVSTLHTNAIEETYDNTISRDVTSKAEIPLARQGEASITYVAYSFGNPTSRTGSEPKILAILRENKQVCNSDLSSRGVLVVTSDRKPFKSFEQLSPDWANTQKSTLLLHLAQ
jgi:hypothetical protein